jgi:nicotinamidase/pyrazinamidase
MMNIRLKKGDALIVVDAQVDFFPGGALPVTNGDQIIPVVNLWLEAAQKADIPIFASRDWHPSNHCSFKQQGGPWPRHCVQNSAGAEIHPEIHLPSQAKIINTASDPKKEDYSAFQGKTKEGIPLNTYMKKKKIHRLWITGLAQDFCVCETALEARSNGYEVHLLLAGTRPITEETGEEALNRMKAAGVIIETDCQPLSSS